MAKEEIVEGLRMAVSKGEPLKQAMMSFYNSGYNKKDIEEAARVMQQPKPQPLFQPITTQAGIPVQQPQIPIQSLQPQALTQLTPLPTPQFRQLPQAPVQTVQMVSNYGKKPRPASFIITLILVFLLLSLLGILAAVFFFKAELTQFFNNAF